MSDIQTVDGDFRPEMRAVLRASVAIENAPYALMATKKVSVARAAGCTPGGGSVAPFASCSRRIDQSGTSVADFASCAPSIGQDDPVATVASCTNVTPVGAVASCGVR